MGRRLALLVGYSVYNNEEFPALKKSEADVHAMAEVLGDPNIGGFEVDSLIDEPVSTTREKIDEFFQKGQRDDSLLLYFSGHGDAWSNEGILYLVGTDTKPDRLESTAISSRSLNTMMNSSKAKTQVLILDCCYSGAFVGDGKSKLPTDQDTAELLKGRGRVILTASRDSEKAWAGDDTKDLSDFTWYLVQGLKTGEAASNGEGEITPFMLYQYVYKRLEQESKQTPGISVKYQEGDILLAKSPIKSRREPSSLDWEEWKKKHPPISDLHPEILNLGPTEAATFPFIIQPIQREYETAIKSLQDACAETARSGSGILILGRFNTGKTRLAIEALKETFPTWPFLHWKPWYTVEHDAPSQALLAEQQVILFIDDLQDYIPISDEAIGRQLQVADPRASQLRMLVEQLIQFARCAVIVVTCRTEKIEQVLPVFRWLFDILKTIEVPVFARETDDPQTKDILREFKLQGAKHAEDWNGTLGSLVLGLSKQRDEYLKVRNAPAGVVLKAMKLLTLEGIKSHSEQRLRATCATVFGKKALQKDEEVWQMAVTELTRMQFVREGMAEGRVEGVLVPLKEEYLVQAVTDYPSPDRPYQLMQNRLQLQKVLRTLRDAEGLLAMGIATLSGSDEYLSRIWTQQVQSPKPSISSPPGREEMPLMDLNVPQRLKEALDTFNHILKFKKNFFDALYYKSTVLIALKEYEKALEVLNHALRLKSHDPQLLSAKIIALGRAERTEEALNVLEQALESQPSSVILPAAMSLGFILEQQDHIQEAQTAYQHAIDSDLPGIVAQAGVNLWFLLRKQEKHEEAQVALQRAIDTHYANRLEVTSAVEGDQPDVEKQMLISFIMSKVYTLGKPAGTISTSGLFGTDADLLHFAVDIDGEEQIMVPVFTRFEIMAEAVLHTPEWQSLMVLEVQGGSLVDNLEQDVTIVINPWSPFEFQLSMQRLQDDIAAFRAPLLEEVISATTARSHEPEAVTQVFQQFLKSTLSALGFPIDSTMTRFSLLTFEDIVDGEQRRYLPAFTRCEMIGEALRYHPEWQSAQLLRVDGSSLIRDIDQSIIIVINPWSQLKIWLRRS